MSNMLTAAAADLEASQAEYVEAEAAYAEASARRTAAHRRLIESQREMARHLNGFKARAPMGTPWSDENGGEIRSLLRNQSGGEGK